jgi:hypothetical protein
VLSLLLLNAPNSDDVPGAEPPTRGVGGGAAPPMYKVYVSARGDFYRTPAGAVRLYADRDEAQAAAEAQQGFVLPAEAPSPGGFDRTWA